MYSVLSNTCFVNLYKNITDYGVYFKNKHVNIISFLVKEEESMDQVTKYARTTATTKPSYTAQKPSRYSGRLKNKQSSVYRSSSLNQAVLELQSNDQEPVTVHFFVSH